MKIEIGEKQDMEMLECVNSLINGVKVNANNNDVMLIFPFNVLHLDIPVTIKIAHTEKDNQYVFSDDGKIIDYFLNTLNLDIDYIQGIVNTSQNFGVILEDNEIVLYCNDSYFNQTLFELIKMENFMGLSYKIKTEVKK